MMGSEMVLGTSVICNEVTSEALKDFISLSLMKASDLQITKPAVFMKLNAKYIYTFLMPKFALLCPESSR
jgi:hypothetical protein